MIIIRADGGNGIGMGHLARTSVLAKELSKYQEVGYVCSNEYQEGIAYLRNQKLKVIETDCVEETLLKLPGECIITDHYGIDLTYIKRIREHFKVVGYIDDNATHHYQADFIVNQNFRAEDICYNVEKGCDLLLGAHYLLVREEFRQESRIQINKQVENILLTVGGSDQYNYTEKLIESIYDLPFDFHVVIGPAFPFQKQLFNRYSKCGNIHFEVTPNMSEVASKCDMAISSCGSTLYELGLLGIPTIGIVVADNQSELAKRMSQSGMIQLVGEINAISSAALRKTIMQVVSSKQKRMQLQSLNLKELNAQGAEVVAQYIIHKMRG